MREPTQEYLEECFRYNHALGVLIWKERPRHHFNTHHSWSRWNTIHSGKIAGGECLKNKSGNRYWKITLQGKRYFRSRLIYVLHFGCIKNNFIIDHKSGDTLDDNISNLRLVSQRINCYNKKKQVNNNTGVTGVSLERRQYRYRSHCTENGKRRILYSGPDFFEAVCARKSWELKKPHITSRHGK